MGTLAKQKTTMASRHSLVSELISAIKVPKLRPMPAYLSETDALTANEFMQCNYAGKYELDTSNVHWGGKVNTNHIFDIYSEYHPHKESVKTRLEMISYVTNNYHRYSWDGHLFLRLNDLLLETWINKMSYWGNCADALSLYALSDMYGVHTCVLTKSKPWTTIDNSFEGTVDDVLTVCQVKLVYLGANKFGRLWEKVVRDAPSYYGASFNYGPMVAMPSVPSCEELETAQTLVEMQNTDVYSVPQLSTPPLFQGPDVPVDADAMDKITSRLDVRVSSALKIPDAMDQLIKIENTNNIALYVEMDGDQESLVLQVAAPKTKTFYVETPTPKQCHVCVTPLEAIVFSDADPHPAPKGIVNDLPEGEHFTRSCTRSKPE